MLHQTIQFAVITENEKVQQIGKSTVYTPKVAYKGDGIKWLDDTVYKKNQINEKNKNQKGEVGEDVYSCSHEQIKYEWI